MDARKEAIAERLALSVKEQVGQLIAMAKRGLVWVDPAHKAKGGSQGVRTLPRKDYDLNESMHRRDACRPP